jgi:hypothetical protein
MRPGQLRPNDFELAILERIAGNEPSIRGSVQQLRVLSRELTGAGSFTKFRCDESVGSWAERHLSLDATISMPGVAGGLGAVLFCKCGQPECLEIYTYGEDHWDGAYDGFSIDQAA